MSVYEYVSKKEYQPIREQLESIINEVQKLLKKEKTGITFQFKLIGSGGHHLITRRCGLTDGYDFDYNLILNCDPGYHWKPKYARISIFNAIKRAVTNTDFSIPVQLHSVIHIKSKKHNHSCDFAIVYYENEDDQQYKCAKYNKENDSYSWELRKDADKYQYKLDWLKHNVDDYWNLVRGEYLLLKNNNRDKDKRSFQLYYEAINNVYNQNAFRFSNLINNGRKW